MSPTFVILAFETAPFFLIFIFNFHHVVEEVSNSYKDALLSIFVLIHWMSSCSLNLGSEAEKCPFREGRNNTLGKIGKYTNSAPYTPTPN